MTTFKTICENFYFQVKTTFKKSCKQVKRNVEKNVIKRLIITFINCYEKINSSFNNIFQMLTTFSNNLKTLRESLLTTVEKCCKKNCQQRSKNVARRFQQQSKDVEKRLLTTFRKYWKNNISNTRCHIVLLYGNIEACNICANIAKDLWQPFLPLQEAIFIVRFN